jgi:release factor glutamine methyltransferase
MTVASLFSLDERLAEAARALAAAGVEDAPREARRLIQLALGTDAAQMFARKPGPLAPEEDAAFARLLARRVERVPFARLAGEREFWSLSFHLVAAALVPRPETETLVEAALGRIDDRGASVRVLDLGTGSGCLLLALLTELPRATGLGVDADRAALDCARANAARLGLAARTDWRLGDWAAGLEGSFDVVLANPPYVAEREWETLQPEVRDHDPRLALVAGSCGLAAYRRILPELPRLLARPDRGASFYARGDSPARRGFACLEIGAGQAEAVGLLAAEGGLRVVDIRRDLAGTKRCVVLATA